MGETQKAIFESNGLLDFFPTPPQSLEQDLEPPTKAARVAQRPSQYQYDDDEPPPPDFDEEPSDFEDEILGIMEREQQSSSSSRPFDGMDIDDEEYMPVASCESTIIDRTDDSFATKITPIPHSAPGRRGTSIEDAPRLCSFH